MCFSLFFVTAGILLNVVCESFFVPNKLCVGKYGYMAIGEDTKLLSIIKNEKYPDKTLVDSAGQNGYMKINFQEETGPETNNIGGYGSYGDYGDFGYPSYFSKMKNGNDHNTILVTSNPKKGFKEKFLFTCHKKHKFPMFDSIPLYNLIFIFIFLQHFFLLNYKRLNFNEIDAKFYKLNEKVMAISSTF